MDDFIWAIHAAWSPVPLSISRQAPQGFLFIVGRQLTPIILS
jgi:hypothetical protein